MKTRFVWRQWLCTVILGSCLVGTSPALGEDAKEENLVYPEIRKPHTRLVYDSNRRVIVLFGRSARGETWEWDWTRWDLRSTDGPGGRLYSSLAYDSARGVTVLFGGNFGKRRPDAPVAGDTWEWDGKTWSKRSDAGPERRCCHGMTYDERHGVTVLFGGHLRSGELVNDTWEWDGHRWSLQSVTGPSPRASPSLAYDTRRKAVMLVGGIDRTGIDKFQEGTWNWDGRAWNSMTARDSPSLVGGALVPGPARDVMSLWGGWGVDEETNSDVWLWDGSNWSVSAPLPLPPIDGKITLLYEPHDKTILLCRLRAYDDPAVADIWALENGAWKKKTSAPLPE